MKLLNVSAWHSESTLFLKQICCCRRVIDLQLPSIITG